MEEGGRASRANGVGPLQLGWHTGGSGRPDFGLELRGAGSATGV